MPKADPDVAEAAAVANAVLDEASKYVNGRLKDMNGPMNGPDHSAILEKIFAQHVSVQVSRLQHVWAQEGNAKTVAALEGMGNGLQNLSVACGKHSLHVKLVE